MTQKNVLVTITGPSLTGKSTLAEDLMYAHPATFEAVVTHTTRPLREGEVDGKSYHFVSKDEFLKLLEHGGFVEHAQVGPVGNTHFYGTSKAAIKKVLDNGKNPLLVIEPEGAANVYKYAQSNQFKIYQIFLNNPRDVRLQRFLERFAKDKLATPENYTKRLMNILDVEPEKWINPALNGTHRYDDIFESFDANRQEVGTKVVDKVRQMCSTENKPKFR